MPMAETNGSETPGPYPSGAGAYWDAGWRGILPLPPGRKKYPPGGFTGWHGAWPSWPDIQEWGEIHPDGNLALRLPGDIIGIDVDNYGDKPGAATLAACEAKWGALPPTWRSTSRDDGISGIRLYRVPQGLQWPGELPGGGVEMIHVGHRYVVAWPSIHPEGRTYRWLNDNGVASISVPTPDRLPMLPADWIVGLAKGAHKDEPRAELTTDEAARFLTALPGAEQQPCRFMQRRLELALGTVHGGGSRHEAVRDRVLAMVRFGESGHPGAITALTTLRDEFFAAVAADGSRSTDEAGAEWVRILQGALRIVAASPSIQVVEGDPCGPPVPKLRTSPATSPRPRPEPGATSSDLVPPRPDLAPTSPEASTSANGATSPDLVPPRPESGTTSPDLAPTSPQVVPPRPDAGTSSPDNGTTLPTACERSSWWPVDLGPILSGETVQQGPTVLARTDGQCLLYPGRINGIIGPSESGKTWIALLAVAQAIEAGKTVMYLDFEDTAAGIITRCRDLGIADEKILAHLRYLSPDEALNAIATGDLEEALATFTPDVIVLDGVNAAMTLLGLDLMSNRDATAFHQSVLKPLSATGAAVVYIDHTPKNNTESAGGIGAQAKRAMTTGAALRVEVIAQFGRGQEGTLKVTVDKDRAGFVRGACQDSRTVGLAKLRSGDDGRVEVTIEMEENTHTESGDFRPTVIMKRVADFLITMRDGASGKAIEQAVKGKRDYVRIAVQRLVEERYVKRTPGARGAVIHTLERLFSEDDEPPRPTSPRPRPDLAPGEVELTSPLSPSLSGREGEAGRGQTAAGRAERAGLEFAPRGEVQRRGAEEAKLRPRTYRLDGYLIDEETGEVLEMPESESER